MTDEQLDAAIAALNARAPGYAVRIDDDMDHGISGSARAASDGARARAEALANGVRVAHVFTNDVETMSALVGREQVARLLRAGAIWTGPAHYAPAGV